jgi:hypothetical protein
MAETTAPQSGTPLEAGLGTAIAAGIRKKYPGSYDDMKDVDIVQGLYQKHYSDLEGPVFLSKMQANFAPDYKAAEPVKSQTLGERAAGIGKALVELPATIGEGLATSLASPATAVVQTAKSWAAMPAAASLLKTAEGIPELDVPALKAKGYTDARIAHLQKQRGLVIRSLNRDVINTTNEGIDQAKGALGSTAEAIAMYGPMKLIPSAAKGLVAKGLVGTAAKGTVEGALFGAAYGGIKGGLDTAVDETITGGKTPSQIFKDAVAGGVKEAIPMAAGGAVFGAAAGVIGNRIASSTRVMPAARNLFDAFGETLAPAANSISGALLRTLGKVNVGPEAPAAQVAAMGRFADAFKPEWIGERFSTAVKPELTDEQIARNIMAQLGSTTPEAVPQSVADVVAEKVWKFRATQPEVFGGPSEGTAALAARGMGVKPEVGLESTPGAVAAPQGIESIAQPAGAPVERSLGGAAPMPNEYDQGAIGQRTTPFAPVATATPEAGPAGIQPEAGLEPTGIPGPFVPPHTPSAAEVLGGEGRGAALAAPPVPAAAREPAPAEVIGGEARGAALAATPAGPVPSTVEQRRVARGEITPAQTAVNAVKTLGEEIPSKTTTRKIGNVEVSVSTTPGDRGFKIDRIESMDPAAVGEGSAALKQVLAVADEHQVPVEVYAEPFVPQKGGKIPLEKLVKWYEDHGFQVIDDFGGTDAALLRREPTSLNPVTPEVAAGLAEQGAAIGDRVKGIDAAKAVEAAGNVVEGKPLIRGSLGEKVERQLDLFADAARARLKDKQGRLLSGVDPTDLTDWSIIGAAQMFKLGMRSKKAFTEAMVKLYGDVILPHITPVYEASLKVLKRSISGGPTQKQLAHLMSLAESGKHGMNWYEGTAKWADRTFGADADMFLRFLAATSADPQNEAGATMALKAYSQWKMGMPFDGMRSKSMVMNLERASRGNPFGGDKVDSYYRALRGDVDAVVLDRWMMRALGFKNASTVGNAGALGGTQYKMFSAIVRDLAEQAKMTPRQYQAAIWEGSRVQSLHGRFAQGGSTAASKVGSAHPLETLVENRLGGMTPMQWAEANSLRFETLRNISTGLKASRGEQGGYTYNPFTYEADKTPGYVVTLASAIVPKKLFYSTAIVDFRKQFANQIDMSGYGDLLRGGQHLTVGTWNMGAKKPDHFSIDLNITLPEEMREQALAFGLKNRQYEVGHIGPDGNYIEGIQTGYDPKVHGPQDVAPAAVVNSAGTMKHPKERAAWFEKANVRVGQLLDEIGSTGPPAAVTADGTIKLADGALKYIVDNPSQVIAHTAEVLGKTPAEVKAMIDAGQYKPTTDAGVLGAVIVTKDGTIWKYVDPKAPSYNTLELFGSLRGKKRLELLNQLKGMEVIKGHDVIDKAWGESGFARIAMPEPMPDVEVMKVFNQMVAKGATVVPPSALDINVSRPSHDSFWLFPKGRLVRIDISHGRFAQLLKIPGVKGFVEGIAGGRMQTLMNQGIIRVQASGESVAFDVSAKITPQQRAIMRTAIDKHPSWAAQITTEKGELVSFFGSQQGAKVHHFLAQAGGEGS